MLISSSGIGENLAACVRVIRNMTIDKQLPSAAVEQQEVSWYYSQHLRIRNMINVREENAIAHLLPVSRADQVR